MAEGDPQTKFVVDNIIAGCEVRWQDCNHKVGTIHLEKISSYCSQWRLLPHHLHLEAGVVESVDARFTGERDRRHAFFIQWRQEKDYGATYRELMNALVELGCANEAAQVCMLLKNIPISPHCYPVRPTYRRPYLSGLLCSRN